jgi:hypothetical protein
MINIFRWLLAILLLLASVFFGYGSTCYIWIADFRLHEIPRMSDPNEAIRLAYIYIALAGLFFVGFVILLVKNIRKIIAQYKPKGLETTEQD